MNDYIVIINIELFNKYINNIKVQITANNEEEATEKAIDKVLSNINVYIDSIIKIKC